MGHRSEEARVTTHPARALATAVSVGVAATVLVSAPVAAVPAGAAPATPAALAGDTFRLGGVPVRAGAATRQVITVNASGGHSAVVALWTKRDGRWQRTARSRSGRIGYGGLVPGRERRQGTGTTPLGSYAITETFGIARRPAATRLPFHRVLRGDYWVQDNRSRYYNERRHVSLGGFRPHTSEHLIDYGGQYRWSLVIDFNRPDPVRRRGSGIFLHVNGPGATAGCVSASRGFIRLMLTRLRPGWDPLIAIGR
jgi:L,D-peptidoglycan transpeptidase YkuD (ErfK/YbiS/YcfS/YnhG family)